MVNLGKRMHRLMPALYSVKGGAGAAILPPKPPAPQLTNVVLRLPNPSGGYDWGAHAFWRNVLPSFRYHNLTIPIKVEQTLKATPDIAPTLTLQFEATTKEALEQQKAKPTYTDQEGLTEWRDKLRSKRVTQARGEVTGGPVVKNNPDSRANQLRKQQEEIGILPEFATKIGAISLKPQPPADPAAPSTTSPPPTIYQRTLMLGLRGRPYQDIWKWFQTVTNARPYKLARVEVTDRQRYRRHAVRSAKDRTRVKTALDAMRKEKADVERARQAAERLATS